MPKTTDPKIAMFHELRELNRVSSSIAHRAIGTPFYDRANLIAIKSGEMMTDFQRDPEAMIDNLDDHGLTPMMLLIGHIVAMEF